MKKAVVRMEQFGNFFQLIKKKLQESWTTFVNDVYRNQRKTLTYLATGMVLAILFAVVIITSQTRIKTSLIHKMAFESLPTSVEPLEYDIADQVINKEKAISVVFSKPNGQALADVFQLIRDKDSELNRTIYYYPIVYDTQTFLDTYNVTANEVTFVFFENGKEKNRFTYQELEQPTEDFIPELNRLPMWNIRELDE
jgi:uncharacterized membrane protein YfbV (UPF0208 family)